MRVHRLVLLAALAACAPATGTPPDQAVDDLVPVELATVGVDPVQSSPVALLRQEGSGQIIPIWIGLPEAQAILRVMLGLETPRPMTHDLLADIVSRLGAVVEEVVVHDIQDATYLGRIRLRLGEDDHLDIDSRPSDALALAIRTDATIRVAAALLIDPPAFDFLAPEAAQQVVRIMGATVVSPTPALRQRHHLPDTLGLVVVGTSGQAAEKGLRRGDLITEVNGMPVHEPMDFLNAALEAIETVRLNVLRDGEAHQLELDPPAAGPGPTPRRGPTPIQT